jgi:hypothetical protein
LYLLHLVSKCNNIGMWKEWVCWRVLALPFVWLYNSLISGHRRSYTVPPLWTCHQLDYALQEQC